MLSLLLSWRMNALFNVVRGFFMGSADVVPGVSGGTIALVLGIYERLVASIQAGAAALAYAARGRFRDSRRRLGNVAWQLVLPLAAGILLAIISLASVIDRLLEDEPQTTAAAFFGLVLGSIYIAGRLIERWDATRLGTALVVAVAAFFLLGLRGDAVTDPGGLLFLGAGAVAIVAMILPGISGSFILVMLGMYQATLDVVNERDMGMAGLFVLGAVIGLAFFSTILNRLLRDHHEVTLAALVGLMAGSLRVLWPWPDGTESTRLAAPSEWGGPLLAAVLGLLLVVAIWLASRRIAGESQSEGTTASAGAAE